MIIRPAPASVTGTRDRGFAAFTALAIFLISLFCPADSVAQTYAVFHTSNKTIWDIYDINVYNAHKADFNAITKPLDSAVAQLDAWFLEFAPKEVKFRVNKMWCGVNAVIPEFGDTCAFQASKLWINFALLDKLAYTVTNPITGNWPDDSFQSGFRNMVTASLVNAVLGKDSVARFENEYMDNAARPQYLAYMKMKEAKGWGIFRALFRALQKDSLDLGAIAQDPPTLRSAYVMAYLNLGNLEKLSPTLKADGVPGFDPAEATKVLDARNLLAIADRRKMNAQAAWSAFRAGRYADVKSALGPLPYP